MHTIKGEITHEIEIKKSIFICRIKHIISVKEAQDYIENIKKLHGDATHNCSVYIVSNHEKTNDDGEPSGTAALPMLQVLKHHDINNVVCVVTRYFGGIKLGAGGLIRAYGKSISQTIKSTTLIKLVTGHIVELTIPFDSNDKVKYYFQKNNVDILNITFDLKVIYNIKISSDLYLKVSNDIKNINHLNKIRIIDDIMIESDV